MHDPSTVAFEIRYPWWRYRPWPKRTRRSMDDKWAWDRLTEAEKVGRSQMWRDGYRESFVTIWHEDPERDGTDDSCGYSVQKLTREQKDRLKHFAWNEARDPYYMRCPEKRWTGSDAEAEAIYRGLILNVARVLRIRMSFEEAARFAAMEIHMPDCTPRTGFLCFKPGWHTNFKEDRKDLREEEFWGRICNIARWLLTERRPWWRHPKWHIWHWRIQVHMLQEFKRWAFSRCETCRKGFRWGESPVSNSWDGTGPLWFRREKGVNHMKCSGQGVASATQPEEEAKP